ncbi:MAG: sigma-54-dependent transcriptional regulator, partial [Steroidobacteraceae bacterium]
MPESVLPGRVIVVDDDPDVLTAARMALASAVASVEALRSPTQLADALAQAPADAVLLDMNFAIGAHSGLEGLDWLARIHTLDPHASVVLMTAFGGISLAVESLKSGAVDFVLKPWQNDKLVATISAAVSLAQARREATDLKTRNAALASATVAPNGVIIGSAPALRRVFDLVRRAAPTDANVLILGESGTGKELTAREIHRLSPRAAQPFVSVDLGALPDTLFESELFGHRRGAFTGADADRVGRIQAAQSGTLFFDEIGNLPLHLQRKLLTVLERREVLPVGATRPVSIDVRLVTATNRTSADLAREEVFRQDLLFRIKTVEIVLPPLRERREDIPALLEHFLVVYSRKYNVPRRRLSPQVLAALEDYSWPGNVRELHHAVERATILAAGEKLTPEDFPFLGAAPAAPPVDGEFALDSIERSAIEGALAHYQG